MFFRDSTVYCLLSGHSCGSWQDGRKRRNVTTSADSVQQHCCLPALTVSSSVGPSGWAASPQTAKPQLAALCLNRAEGDNSEPLPPPLMKKGHIWDGKCG